MSSRCARRSPGWSSPTPRGVTSSGCGCGSAHCGKWCPNPYRSVGLWCAMPRACPTPSWSSSTSRPKCVAPPAAVGRKSLRNGPSGVRGAKAQTSGYCKATSSWWHRWMCHESDSGWRHFAIGYFLPTMCMTEITETTISLPAAPASSNRDSAESCSPTAVLVPWQAPTDLCPTPIRPRTVDNAGQRE